MAIGTSEARDLFKHAANSIRTLVQERDQLRQELDGLQKEARARDITSRMVQKGFLDHDDSAEKVAELIGRDDLDVVEQAVTMAGPAGVKLAHRLDDESSSGPTISRFEQRLTGVDPDDE